MQSRQSVRAGDQGSAVQEIFAFPMDIPAAAAPPCVSGGMREEIRLTAWPSRHS